MIYFLYKTTNLLTGRYYIGIHSCKDDNDAYYGSGIILRRSLKKHGKENHQREILKYASSRRELYELEEKAVNEELLKDPLCMNVVQGGRGVLGLKHSEDSKFVMSEKAKERFSNPEKLEAFKESKKRQKRRSDAEEMIMIAPDGMIYNLAIGLKAFCDEHELPYYTIRSWVNRGKINLKYVKSKESLNANGWEVRSKAKYYST